MSVINVKVTNIRPKYNNLKEWVKDPNNVYIGRAGIVFIDNERFPKEASIFANPYKIDKDGNRDEVITKYKKYILNKISSDDTFAKELSSIKGKVLGCWCKPEKCHGDVLLELVNQFTYFKYFEGECCICNQYCNEMSGWKCGFCNKVFCDAHNCEDFLCNCY